MRLNDSMQDNLENPENGPVQTLHYIQSNRVPALITSSRRIPNCHQNAYLDATSCEDHPDNLAYAGKPAAREHARRRVS